MLAYNAPTADFYNTPNYETMLSNSYQTGSVLDISRRGAFLNLKQPYTEEQAEIPYLQTPLAQEIEYRYQNVLSIFKQRFEADRDIFAHIEEQKIMHVFEQMAKLLLLLSPSKISADITQDASIIIQAHLGPNRFYWETYMDEDDSDLHSSINIFIDKELKYTGTNSFQDIRLQMSNAVQSILFKQK
ncbi:MAG: hypothetical protein HUU34_12890 [Saprospiraceae bacterium]|nr:hypothetical protein [Saprospiraceae bacterium]